MRNINIMALKSLVSMIIYFIQLVVFFDYLFGDSLSETAGNWRFKIKFHSGEL